MSSSHGNTDRPLDDALAAALIASQFPDLAPVTITARYEGMDNEAFEVNGEWIFRFPKRAAQEKFLRMELGLLPRLQTVVPVPIPHYEWIGRPDERFPYLWAGYRKLPGTPGIQLPLPAPGPLGASLGHLLSVIHSFPVEEAIALGVYLEEEEDPIASMQQEGLEELTRVRSVLTPQVCRRARQILEAAVEPYEGPLVFLHADLSSEHVLLDPETEKITGLIDWTDAAAGDPASELAYLWVWEGEPLVEAVLATYEGVVDSRFRERVRFYGVSQALSELMYGLDRGHDENRESGIRALNRLVEGTSP